MRIIISTRHALLSTLILFNIDGSAIAQEIDVFEVKFERGVSKSFTVANTKGKYVYFYGEGDYLTALDSHCFISGFHNVGDQDVVFLGFPPGKISWAVSTKFRYKGPTISVQCYRR